MLYSLHLSICMMFWRSHEEFDCYALLLELFEEEAEVCASLALTHKGYGLRLFVNGKDLFSTFIRAKKWFFVLLNFMPLAKECLIYDGKNILHMCEYD